MIERSNSPQVRIKHLRLRVPGKSREAGQAVARLLEGRLADIHAGSQTIHLGAVRVRLPASPHLSPEAIADAAAGTIGRAVGKNQRPSSHA